jgi:hypothetical protein
MASASKELFFFLIKSSLKIAVFWDMIPHSLVVCYQYLGETCCLYFQGGRIVITWDLTNLFTWMQWNAVIMNFSKTLVWWWGVFGLTGLNTLTTTENAVLCAEHVACCHSSHHSAADPFMYCHREHWIGMFSLYHFVSSDYMLSLSDNSQ